MCHFNVKILNLYAGIGGNRKLWGDNHETTVLVYKKCGNKET